MESEAKELMKRLSIIRNPAPVGKKMICFQQMAMEFLDQNVGSPQEKTSELCSSTEDSPSSLPYNTSSSESEIGGYRKVDRMTMSIVDRQNLYHEAEQRLSGGTFNVFEQRAPLFKLASGANDGANVDKISEDQNLFEKNLSDEKLQLDNSFKSEKPCIQAYANYEGHSMEEARQHTFDSPGKSTELREVSHQLEKSEESSYDNIIVTPPAKLTRVAQKAKKVAFSDEMKQRKISKNTTIKRACSELTLIPRKIVTSSFYHTPGRYPKRNRILPLRPWFGERAVYQPTDDGPVLQGVTPVIISDKLLLKKIQNDH